MDPPRRIACKINVAPIAIIRGMLIAAVEKPSTKFLVRSGTINPDNVVVILNNKPKVNPILGISVDKISERNGFKLFCFVFIVNYAPFARV